MPKHAQTQHANTLHHLSCCPVCRPTEERSARGDRQTQAAGTAEAGGLWQKHPGLPMLLGADPQVGWHSAAQIFTTCSYQIHLWNGYRHRRHCTPGPLKVNPSTPDIRQICSKRSFDGQIRKWRRDLHYWDPTAEEGGEDPDEPVLVGAG